jgi:contractile injection system tube protein
MTKRRLAVLTAFLLIAVAAFAQKNATSMLKLLRLEGKQQTFLLEASEITTEASATWETSRQSEGDEPTLEFTSGSPKTLSVELFFDTLESKENVYDRNVRPLEELTVPDPNLKRPPMVSVTWSNNLPAFQGVVESVSTKYTMFLPNGTPCRATCTLKMKAATKVTTKTSPCP